MTTMTIRANGIGIHGTDSGSEGPALVFLHYWGGTSRSWRPVITALPGDPRLIALDARGWGGSDRPEGGYDVGTMAEDVAAAVEVLGLDDFILVGHSMGGKVAQLLASRCPSGLAGLVLVAPSPAQGKRMPADVLEQIARAYDTPETITRTVETVLAAAKLPPAVLTQVIEDSLDGAPAAKAAWPGGGLAEDVSRDLSKISVPVLVIGGDRDRVDDVDTLRTVVVPALPGAKMVVIAGGGHMLPLEVPEEVARHIAVFREGLAESFRFGVRRSCS